MKEKPLSDLNFDELQKKEKTLKTVVAALGGLLIVLFGTCGFLTYRQGFSVFTVLPFIFLTMLLSPFIALKKVRTEIAARV